MQRPKSDNAWLLPVIALAAVLLFAMVYFNNDSAPSGGEGANHPAVGTSLSALQVEPLIDADEPVELAQLRGQVTLVNFWGPWCYYCMVEMPHLVELHETFVDNKDFRLLSISSAAQPGSLDQLRSDSQEKLDEFGATWPVYADPQQSSQRAVVMLPGMQRGFGFPTTVLLDREGKVAGLWVGYMEGMENEIEQTVQQELARK